MSWKQIPFADEVATLSDVAPNTIEPDDSASAGVAEAASRQDHEHAIVCASASGAVAESASAAEGSASSFARSDHVHECPATWAPTAHEASHKDGGSDEILLHELGEPTSDVDFNDQAAINFKLEAAASYSGTPADGSIFFDTDDDHVYVYVA